jgi:GNAT-family acetyltransferase (TIGR03103 family)
MSLARTPNHRLERNASLATRFRRPQQPAEVEQEDPRGDAVLDCGWGRLIFAHTFDCVERVVETLRGEEAGRRDIAVYLQDPHVALARAPQELFLDPSHTYRLWLSEYRHSRRRPRGYVVHRLRGKEDADAVNRIYASRGMVTADPEFLIANRHSRTLSHFVAVDNRTGTVVGTVTGVDHRRAFGDPEQGSSLWCLAVDPQASFPGIGETLVRTVAEHFLARGRAFLDLSVLHDNMSAISLYEKLGFRRIQSFSVKTKNSINERLFMGPPPGEKLNPYATILINEARRRGIGVEVLDAEAGYFCLSSGGRSVVCRESLTELTSAVAMSRCDDKTITLRVLKNAGLAIPAQTVATDPDSDAAFLKTQGSVVVKPARGEQGRGITVDVRDTETLATAIETARRFCDTVVLEQFFEGEDLRIVVIDFEVVAAAVRRPAQVVGDGQHSIRDLIETTSRRRAAATGGESRIPMDAETERCVRIAGWSLDDVLPAGTVLPVRKTANLHTGGTIHDVTAQLHPELAKAATDAARALNIPVVGLDLLVKAPDRPEHVFIEANERPGLANHEPQPTAERFIDLLFPQSKGAA